MTKKNNVNASQLRKQIWDAILNNSADFGWNNDALKMEKLVDALDTFITANTDSKTNKTNTKMEFLQTSLNKYNNTNKLDEKRKDLAKDICALVGAPYEMDIRSSAIKKSDSPSMIKSIGQTMKKPVLMGEAAAAASKSAAPATPTYKSASHPARQYYEQIKSKNAAAKPTTFKPVAPTRERPIEIRVKPAQSKRHHIDRNASSSPEKRRAKATPAERQAAKVTASELYHASEPTAFKPRGPKR